MNSDELKEEIKNYLYIFPYHILHEDYKGKEVFFALVSKKDINQDWLNEFWSLYEQTYPIKNLSAKSLKFIKENKDNYYAVWVETLDLEDSFFETKKNYIENNANNIIAIRTIGVAADPLEHMEYSAQNALTQIKDVSKGVFGAIKDEVKSQLTEKTPVIKRKVKLLKNKLLNK